MRKKSDSADFQDRIFDQMSELHEERNRAILEKASGAGLTR